ncbi:hypothetical protein J6590_021592 [Homalodisca vitripennis]|nr:hypothetical protein J6590_021592 [Homalodisca vitripennis]
MTSREDKDVIWGGGVWCCFFGVVGVAMRNEVKEAYGPCKACNRLLAVAVDCRVQTLYQDGSRNRRGMCLSKITITTTPPPPLQPVPYYHSCLTRTPQLDITSPVRDLLSDLPRAGTSGRLCGFHLQGLINGPNQTVVYYCPDTDSREWRCGRRYPAAAAVEQSEATDPVTCRGIVHPPAAQCRNNCLRDRVYGRTNNR